MVVTDVVALHRPNFEALECAMTAWPDIDLAVIGATALAIRGAPPARRSDDVDIAVAVGVHDLSEIGARLQPPGWEAQRRMPHRWRHHARRLRLDIIPAGVPPGHERSLQLARGLTIDVRGLEVAISSAEPVEVSCDGAPELRLTPATPPLAVLVLLKMIAFIDKPALREMDATDVARVMHAYLPEMDDRRWEAPVSTLHDEDFKGAFALGVDMRPHLIPEYQTIVEAFAHDAVARGKMQRYWSTRPDAGNAAARAFLSGLDVGA